MTALVDVPSADVIRHHSAAPRRRAAPAGANVLAMPMAGRELRLVDVVDVNSPDEVGPPELYAWLHYDPIPSARRLGQGADRVFHRPSWAFRPRCARTRASAPARRI